MVRVWFLENEGLPYLVGEYNTSTRADFELEKFRKRMTNPDSQIWWLYKEEYEKQK